MTRSLGDALAAMLDDAGDDAPAASGAASRDGGDGVLDGLSGARAEVTPILLTVAGIAEDDLEEAPSPDDDLRDDLGFDSLGVVELAVRCEEATGVRFEDEAVGGLRTLGDVIGVVEAGRG
ncbi:acyl carrier protein [Corynebacterium sp. 335C]